MDPANPASATSVNRLDPDYKANKDHEVIVGLDHQLVPNVAMSVAYTWRRTNDWPSWNPRIGLTSADYSPNPSESGNGFTAQTFSPDPAKVAASAGGRILTNRPNYHTGYNGLELSVNKRFTGKWMGRAGFALMDWREFYDGEGASQNPTRTDTIPQEDGGQVARQSYGAKRNIFFNAKWQFNGNAMYQLPYAIQIAGNLFARQGYPRPVVLSIDAGLDGTLRALGTPKVDTERNDTVWNLDLRVAKKFSLTHGANVEVMADLFNATNNGIVLERNRFASSEAFQQINEVISPRIFRIGLRLQF